MDAIYNPEHLGAAVTAVGALGTAAAGVVDGFKSLPGGGLSNVGYSFIRDGVKPFLGGRVIANDTLHANWVNGLAQADQKAIAKTLIKAALTPDNAAAFAAAVEANIDVEVLKRVAQKMTGASADTRLADDEQNALGRFDLALTALLDGVYQHADQRYRNRSKLAATVVSVLLAVIGGLSTSGFDVKLWQWFIVGLLATPLAPMAKDVASALQAGARAAQSLRR